MHSRVDQAVVLRHVDIRESDRIVTVFTRDHGRVSGLARGVRKSVRRFAGRLDLFSHVELSFRPGRGELMQFDEASLVSAHLGLRDDLYRIAWAAYLCELMQRIFGEAEAHPAAFDLLCDMLTYLELRDLPDEGVLRALELRMLDQAGLRPELRVCGRCGVGVDSGRMFSFVVTRGALTCDRCERIPQGDEVPAEVIGRLGATLDMPLEALLERRFTLAHGRASRALLGAFVRYHIGGGLKSATMLVGLEAEARGGGVRAGSCPDRRAPVDGSAE